MTSHEIHELWNRGIELKSAGKKEEARKCFQQLIDEGSHADKGYYHRALMAVDENNIPHAIEYYKAAIKTNPAYYKAHNNLALLYIGQKEFKEAIAHLHEAHRLAPDDMEPVCNFAHCYYTMHDFSTALQWYENIDTEGMEASRIENIKLETGTCYLQLGEFDVAAELFKEVIEEYNDKNIIALNSLGFIYLEARHDAEKADKWITRALEINGKFRPALQNKGLILKALGKMEDAIQYLQQAAEVEPQNFEPVYNLACVYSDLGKEKEVQEYLKKALALAPFIKGHVKQDPDFLKYREADWFKALV